MASGFFAILDDIAALMDDIAVTSKLATKKTAGILGDDLAVNAEKATGFLSSREIPVLWAITKGSFINKVIIIPFIFLLKWLYEPAITYILILGGIYLAYEGVEKIIEFLFHRNKKGHEVVEESTLPEEDEKSEKSKIPGVSEFEYTGEPERDYPKNRHIRPFYGAGTGSTGTWCVLRDGRAYLCDGLQKRTAATGT